VTAAAAGPVAAVGATRRSGKLQRQEERTCEAGGGGDENSLLNIYSQHG
jgi:hypothetical protein